MKIRILGCGSSGGVPLVTGEWGHCDPNEPRNRRTRVSVAVQEGDTTLVIDTSPDFRYQLLRANIFQIDAVLYTHDHADHTHGIDDLRPMHYAKGNQIPIYADENTLQGLKERFPYIFRHPTEVPELYKGFAEPRIITGPFQVGNLEVIPFEQDHGYQTTLGYRIGDFAYSTDVVRLSDEAFKVLEGVKVWVVDCVSREPKTTHSHLEQTLQWIEHVKPNVAYLTHMSALLDYQTLRSELPDGVYPAYDNCLIEM